jgi:hypothetical protein
MSCVILLGEGHSEKGLGEKLLSTLPAGARGRIVLVPSSLSLDAYAALIDFSDFFISGDTGPLHVAAARKHSKDGSSVFRNRTVVLSVFGATPPRFSGYDSRRVGFMGSSQDAPSDAYQSRSSCRNITCVHKMALVCDAKGCFQSLDVAGILSGIRVRLEELALNLPYSSASSRAPAPWNMALS